MRSHAGREALPLAAAPTLPAVVSMDVPVTAADPDVVPASAPIVPAYAPSWLDRLTRTLDVLPGPTWLAYAMLMAGAIGISVAIPLTSGRAEFDPVVNQVFWGVVMAVVVWLAANLSDTAGAAFDRFRPALEADEEAAARLRYELTVTPSRPAWIVLVAAALFTPLYYVADPVASDVVGLSPVGLALRYVIEAAFGAVVLVVLYQAVRQLRLVSRIHEAATRVDLYRPEPAFAFSVLTARTAMAIALVFTVPTLVAAAQVASESNAILIYAPWVAVGVSAAVAIFLLPLRGMQRRIRAEKRRLEDEAGRRVERVSEEISRRVDEGDFAGVAALQASLNVVIAQRDLVAHLPTLPWRAGTARGLLTAVVLPLVMFVVTRLIGRFV